METKRTLKQNNRLFSLLNQLKLDDTARADLCFQFTNQRSYSSTDLTVGECNDLCHHLEDIVQKIQKALIKPK